MVKKLEAVFDNKIWSTITKILFPVILVLFALMHIGEGITVTDTGYNYGNFISFDSLDDMWKFSTYLSNAMGAFFTNLPLGQTVLGLNFYTGLFKVITALFAYFFCTKVCKMRREAVFVGEMIALGFCWCPTALIYNYLTYLLFCTGAVCIYIALTREKKYFFVLAGVALGLNVFVRLPNVAEVALIVVVWLAGILDKKKVGQVVKDTLFCILGYVIGLATVFGYIACRYGINRYVEGITALFAMTGEDESYKATSMLLDSFNVYMQYSKWFIWGILFVAGGMLLFKLFDKKYMVIKTGICAVVGVGLVYFFLKKGMFNLNYREYLSIFAWGALVLMFCLVLGVYVIFFSKRKREEKLMAALVCVIILITPIGSNNHLYSPMNNMFLVAPFFVNYIWHLLSDEKSSIMLGKVSFNTIPYKIAMVFFAGIVLVQGVMFGADFVFRDGVDGAKRDACIENNTVLATVYTTRDNAENLQELNDYLLGEELIGEAVILFGNVPALAFYYELEPALSSTWPDLSSFSVEKFTTELDNLSESPMIIVSANPADVGKTEEARASLKQKLAYLEQFMENNQYVQTFTNDAFIVYRCQ